MQLALSEDDARMLRDGLEAYLPELRREVAAIDMPARQLRHELALRLRLCERLVAELQAPAVPPRAED
jgi:hypothetical protein